MSQPTEIQYSRPACCEDCAVNPNGCAWCGREPQATPAACTTPGDHCTDCGRPDAEIGTPDDSYSSCCGAGIGDSWVCSGHIR